MAKSLPNLLIDKKYQIGLTVWYNNLYMDKAQNRRNNVIRATLQHMLKRCSPEVYYTEADMSAGNTHGESFKKLAKNLGLQTYKLRL
jgi:hypothetical protein